MVLKIKLNKIQITHTHTHTHTHTNCTHEIATVIVRTLYSDSIYISYSYISNAFPRYCENLSVMGNIMLSVCIPADEIQNLSFEQNTSALFVL